jgi:hypothetical protein
MRAFVSPQANYAALFAKGGQQILNRGEIELGCHWGWFNQETGLCRHQANQQVAAFAGGWCVRHE